MALPTEIQRSFRLYVTHVDGEGHFLKISGQLDQQASLMVESLFDTARENLEKGIGVVPPGAIHEGIICAAKYKDGTYYRAKIISTTNLANGLVGVHFIDYGNKDIISLSTIRFLDNYDPMFLQLRGQASDYYLSKVTHPAGRWEEPVLLKLQSLLCYSEYPATIEANTRTLPIISIQFKGNDLSTHLVANRFGIEFPIAKQEQLLLQLSMPENQAAPWQPSFPTLESQSYMEHVPFLINSNFPSNPASAMRLQQNVALPFNGSVPPPSLISQRLVVNKVSRNPVSLKAPMRQPQTVPPFSQAAALSAATSIPAQPPVPNSNKPPSPKKSTTYKSRLLEVGTKHKVFVSFAEEGPELFAVQLVTDGHKLQNMMDDINRRPHSSLAEPPMIGTVCLGRMSGDDRIICRAIVMNLSGSQCKLFFVDFGDTEMVSYYDIFDIPEEFVKPNVFAMRFCLSGVKKLEKGPHLTEAFKQLVIGKVLTLRVVPPEGPPLIQYGELYLDDKNVLDLLMSNTKDKMQFKWMEMLPLGSRTSVLVSYVDSCVKFFVQLSETIDDLNAVMDAVKAHCENSTSPGKLPIGVACCARFPEDNNWYRARILSSKGNGKVVVSYVDYGNEHEVDVSDLRTITSELITLPAQAMKCALKGYENKPVETKTSNQLEMLALEKTLTAHIAGVLSNDTMLVSLVDETVSPPLDVARRMMQLSTPRSNIEAKATTPVRKEAPESFSSPESEDGKKNGFRREKSFKDERRPRDGNDEFANRAGSFRSRDNNNGFDRQGEGRHSDKFGGRSDNRTDRDRDNKDGFDRLGQGRHSDKFGGRSDNRPDRDRRGSKPWENNSSAVSPPTPAPAPAGNDDWEESPASTQVEFQPPSSRPNRERDNRRKPRPDFQGPRPDHHGPRSDHHGPRPDHHGPRPDHGSRPDHHGPRPDHQGPRPGWKSKDSGLGRRLRQAVEDASADSQNTQKFSNQDKMKRGNKFNQQNSDWENRPDRRDNRGDRRDNWTDKKDTFQKREYRDRGGEFRDNNRERGDRNRSNFTPRDRAERSFGSDKSDKSYKSSDGNREGRAPPYKPRSKFTQVQYKELTDPVPLETPFAEPIVEVGAQHEVSVTWIISPESFYTQILSLQPKFLEMMHKIPELYKGVKSYTGVVPVGASVLARYPADGVLYRATVVSIQPFSKFIVRYVDFGNKQLVDAKDIWQLDRELMDLPKMAVHCSLLGVGPKDGEWKANPEIDLCFNAPRYQCVFQECGDVGQWKVFLWNNSVNVADTLVEKQLAVTAETESSVALKDEAIDLTIIVEQQILCKVTHVESYDKFYVQLDLDKAALVETAIANYDTSKLTPLTADELSPGVHCTLKHGDKVCRAILLDTQDVDNIQAVLPDYGFPVTTSLANLMILPTELSVYYYQSLECGLNNYTDESQTLMTLEQMKEKLLNNKLIIFINYVDGIRLISTLYDLTTGQKISIFTPDEGAYEEVTQLCARAVFNYNFGLAYISHADSLNNFFMQKSSDSDRITLLLDDMFNFYEEGTPEALTSFEVESICAARSADGNWYRSTIRSVEDNDVKVQYNDYGNSETVPKESIKQLDPKFFEPCELALKASLGLVALQDDALTKLLAWTTDKEVQVTLAFGTDGWLASLHLDGVDLSMKLVNEKLATPHVSSPEEPKVETQAEPVSLPPGCTQVYISHIDTPGHFWLQMADKVDTIEEIQAELQGSADSYANIENRELGTICVAKYLADDLWYRAEILDADSDITTVRFIDYGNTDVLDNQPGLIKVLPDHLKETERYALKSSINAVPTGTGEWSEPASEYFTQLVGDLSSPVDALIVLNDITTYVDIFVDGQNLTDKLVSEGYATKSEEPECGDMPSCFASHINSPSEFWIQLETATSELQAMESAMVDAENFPELTEKEEGVICAAKYPEDGAWYRAQVIVDGSEGTEVLFMDYGNASITNELRSLPEELKNKAALSRKCALQKPRDIKSWSRKSEVKFNELAAEGATIFNVQFIASGDISIVELYFAGKSVTEELVGLCDESQPATERPTPVGQDLLTSGKICYVNSLEEFYVQLDDFAPEIDKILDSMVAAAEFEPISELRVGTVCAAFWDEDEQWYRAKVLEFCDGAHHVLFIDYGNKAKCQEFRQLPEELAVIEPAAKCCRLAGLGDCPKLAQSAKDKLDEYAAEAATFQIEFLDSVKEPALVKLIIDGKDFCSIIAADTVHNEAKAEEPVAAETKEISEDLDKELMEEIIQQSTEVLADVENVVPVIDDVVVDTQKENLVVDTEDLVADTEKVFDPVTETEKSVDPVTETEKVVDPVTETEKSVDPVTDTKKVVEPVSKTEKEIDPVTETENVADLVTETKKVVDLVNETENVVDDTENVVTEKIVADVRNVVTDTENVKNTNILPTEHGLNVAEEDTELNTSQDLNESVDSSKTVIENRSFDCSKTDSSNDDFKDAEGSKDPPTPEKDHSSETLENSNDTIKTPERDDSKDSLNTDTGYTSAGEQDKSPIKDETSSPIKDIESDSLKKEFVENKEIKTETKVIETDSPKKESVDNKKSETENKDLESNSAKKESVESKEIKTETTSIKNEDKTDETVVNTTVTTPE